jgi:hypothetical protein
LWRANLETHARRGTAENRSADRLAAVWREHDAEIEARLALPLPARFCCGQCSARFTLPETLDVHQEEQHGAAVPDEAGRGDEAHDTGGREVNNYKFACKHCGSKFSLEQQRDAHELACGGQQPADGTSAGPPGPRGRPVRCKRCGHESPDIKTHMQHTLAEHREEYRAAQRAASKRRHAERNQIDAGLAAPAGTQGEPTAPATPPPASAPANGNGHHHCCPTCGGPLPHQVAELVDELKKAGIPEAQAFEATRIARRVLAAA